ncbi:hypothetical protein HYW75_00040 [Candidatus Pacearchaeota archaeon]|nr:hypothetical protein [Candidatus Pacearchaeota archaeon]
MTGNLGYQELEMKIIERVRMSHFDQLRKNLEFVKEEEESLRSRFPGEFLVIGYNRLLDHGSDRKSLYRRYITEAVNPQYLCVVGKIEEILELEEEIQQRKWENDFVKIKKSVEVYVSNNEDELRRRYGNDYIAFGEGDKIIDHDTDEIQLSRKLEKNSGLIFITNIDRVLNPREEFIGESVK